MREIDYEGKVIKVLEATGYHDGYYWDLNAKIEYEGETYELFDAGSYSGYYLCCSAITKRKFDRLYGEEQFEIYEFEWKNFEESIVELLNNILESGAKESWESQEDDGGNTHILIDGEEI